VLSEWQKPIKLREEVTIHLREEMETADRLRRYRRERGDEEAQREAERAQM
jgi:predicted DNA-binding antitoxin AbrB/MazE fold protein